MNMFLVESRDPDDPVALRWAKNMDQQEEEFLEGLKTHANTIDSSMRFMGIDNEGAKFLSRLYREGTVLREHLGLVALEISHPGELADEIVLESEAAMHKKRFVKNSTKDELLDELNVALDQIDWAGEVFLLNSEGVHSKIKDDRLVANAYPSDYEDFDELEQVIKIDVSTCVAFVEPLEWSNGTPRLVGSYQHRYIGRLSLSGEFEPMLAVLDPQHPARKAIN